MDEDAVVRAVAEKIRAEYVESAINAYEDAAANGLCAEGAWECAVDAMRHVKLTDLLKELSTELPQLSVDQSSSRLPSGSRR